MTKMDFNGQEKSKVTSAIKTAIKAAMMLCNTNGGDYGESKLDAEIFGDNWKVAVHHYENDYDLSSVNNVNYVFTDYDFSLVYNGDYDFTVSVDIDSLMDYELMCGDFIDSVCNKFYDYLASNIDSEKVKTIVTAVATTPYIDFNSTYIGKRWKLGWLRHKDEEGEELVDYTIYHNGKKAYELGTARLSTIDPIVDAICKLIND